MAEMETYKISQTINFNTPGERDLEARVLALEIFPGGEQINEIRLAIQVSTEVYNCLIDPGELFNLKHSLRGQSYQEEFAPNPDLEIEIRLKNELVSSFCDHINEFEKTGHQLDELRHSGLAPELFHTENWYGLNVKQLIKPPPEFSDNEGEIKAGYQTHWAVAKEDQVNKGLTPVLNAMSDFFSGKNFDVSMFEFKGEPILQIKFKGKNGQWDCYAMYAGEMDVALFYSVCPVKSPLERRTQVSEYLTGINFGLYFGNFEMDLEDGEIRYKTSQQIENEILDPNLFQKTVGINVSLMDRHLPGILAVIEGENPAGISNQ